MPLLIAGDRRSGTIITDCSFETPLKHHVIWGYEPEDITLKYELYAYKRLLDSPLAAVLNQRCLRSATADLL